MDIKILLFVFCVLVAKSFGLRCYTCGFSSVDTDQSCVIITNTTRTVECPYTYCNIMRQEFRDPAGAIASFVRGCVDNPPYLNHEVEDPTYRTFFRACTTDLCNIGNGIQSVVGGNLSPNPVYSGPNLLVPGTGGTIAIQSPSIVIMLIFALLYVIVF